MNLIVEDVYTRIDFGDKVLIVGHAWSTISLVILIAVVLATIAWLCETPKRPDN